MNQREDYRREKNKEMYNKHDSMEYKQQMDSYEERQNYQDEDQWQIQKYKQQESTPNKQDFPGMEDFCNKEELETNMTSIRQPTNVENISQWNEEDSLQQTINEYNAQKKKTRMVYNSKFQQNLPTTRKDQQTRSLNVGNTDQVRFNEQQNRSRQTRYQDQQRFHGQTNRDPQHGKQEKPRYHVPPPNME